MARYADRTEVPVERSRAEIEATLRRYGAEAFMFGQNRDRARIAFEMRGRRIVFDLPLPKAAEHATVAKGGAGGARQRSEGELRAALARVERQRWRALALVIKAKLEAVESGIATMEDIFAADTVLPDGRTVLEHVRPAVERAYLDGSVPPLLPHLGSAP